MTAHATRFVSALTFESLSQHPVFIDQFELGENSDIRHISLADAADLLLVAPATANTIGKFAHGIADDALSTLYLATKAPVLVAPAMNVNMFDHPAVAANLDTLRARGVGDRRARLGLPRVRLARARAAGGGARDRARRPWPLLARTAVDGRPARAGHARARRSRTSTPCASCRTARAGAWATGWPRPPATAAPPSRSSPGPPRSPPRPASSSSPCARRRRWQRAVTGTRVRVDVVAMAAAVSDYRPATVVGRQGQEVRRRRSRSSWCARPTSCAGWAQAKGGPVPGRLRGGDGPRAASTRARSCGRRTSTCWSRTTWASDGSGFAADTNAAVLIDADGEVEVPLVTQARAGGTNLGPRGREIAGAPVARARVNKA